MHKLLKLSQQALKNKQIEVDLRMANLYLTRDG